MRLLTILALTLVAALPALAGDVPRTAPPLKVKSLDGEMISLWRMRGKVVTVMFFSTDCKHCQQAAEALNPIYAELKPKGLEIVGVAVNPTAKDNLAQFRSRFDVQFPIALGKPSDWSRVGGFPITQRPPYLPHMLFVDRKGTIRAERTGKDRDFQSNLAARFRSTVDALLE